MSNNIYDFLISHPLISISGLEKQIGCTKNTISKCVNGTAKIPEKWVDAIENHLKEYGYSTEIETKDYFKLAMECKSYDDCSSLYKEIIADVELEYNVKMTWKRLLGIK